MTEIRICHLYPKEMNIYGDRGNIAVLQKRLKRRGYSSSVTPIGAGEDFNPSIFDLCYLGGGQDRDQMIVAYDLQKKSSALRSGAEDGMVFLWVCGGIQLAGEGYTDSDGQRIPGVGILDLDTSAGNRRLIGDLILNAELDGETSTLVGYENHAGRTFLGPDATPLGSVLKGYGNNGADQTEGAVQERVIGTYMHGPILPKNPWLADKLLTWAIEHNTGGIPTLSPLDDSLENLAQQVAISRAGVKR